MKYLVVGVVGMVIGCGGERHPTTGDAPIAQDAAADARSDGALDASVDSGVDGGAIDAMPDAGIQCQAPGTINRVSADKPPKTKSQLIAATGGTTLVVWGVYPDGVTLDRAVWAQLQGTTVIANGTFAAGVDTTGGQLFVLGSTYYLFSPSSGLYRFDGTSWSAVTGFTASRIVISASHVFGVSTVSGATKAVMFDGTTSTASTQVGSLPFVDVVGDGAGRVGILMYDPTALSLHFVSGDGTTWSAESTVATGPTAWQQFHVASSGTQWGVSAVTVGSAAPHTWLLGGGTWMAADTGLNSMTAFVGNPSAGTFLMVSANGVGALYKAGAWTVSTLTGYLSTDVQVAAFAAGYVVYDTGAVMAFDGTSWTPPHVTNLRSASPFVVSGSMFAIGPGNIEVYRNGTWSEGAGIGDDQLAFDGSELVSASLRGYPPGTTSLWTDIDGPGSHLPTTLPQYATSGPVTDAVVTRGQNGTALAIWSQYDAGVLKGFAAVYTCAEWWPGVSAAPKIHDGYRVAALGTGYVVADGARVDATNGGGFSQVLATGPSTMVASDGTTAVALWQSSTAIEYATSTDISNWTTAQQVDTGSLAGVAGADGNIVAWWLSGSDVIARVWHNGAWSDARSLAAVYSTSCKASVTGSSAVLACTGTATGSLDVELFDGTAWSTISTGSGAFVLGTDGTDVRLEYALGTGSPMATVLHAGAWSTPVADPGADTALGIAGRSGTWDVISANAASYTLATANGAAALGPSAALGPVSTPVSPVDPFAPKAGHTDAKLIEAHPLGYRGISALYVALDL